VKVEDPSALRFILQDELYLLEEDKQNQSSSTEADIESQDDSADCGKIVEDVRHIRDVSVGSASPDTWHGSR